jgi:hypothetical protein
MMESKVLPDGRELSVVPLTFGRARIIVGRVGSYELEDGY